MARIAIGTDEDAMDSQQLMIAAFAIVAVGGLGMAFLEPLVNGEARAAKRQRNIATGSGLKIGKNDTARRRQQVTEALKDLDRRQNAKGVASLEQRMEQAGLTWSKQQFILVSIFCAIALGFGLFVASGQPLVGLGAAFVGGFGLPRWYINRTLKKRLDLFVLEFPNALDSIVRGAKSGLPLGDCIRLLAEEAKEPIKSEFRKVIEATSLGISIPDAVSTMHTRVPIQEVSFFSIVLQIQGKSGGSLSEIISSLSKVIRERKKLRDKAIAASSEAKASAMIIGSLPPLVAVATYFMAPDYISILWTTDSGMIALFVAGFIMMLGILIMRSMINFEI
jgi:tight adherence protein B